MSDNTRVHPIAEVSPRATIGHGERCGLSTLVPLEDAVMLYTGDRGQR